MVGLRPFLGGRAFWILSWATAQRLVAKYDYRWRMCNGAGSSVLAAAWSTLATYSARRAQGTDLACPRQMTASDRWD